MHKNISAQAFRWLMNFFPAYRGTGAKVAFISDDWKQVTVRVPLSWRTKNYVSTIFGGSLYGAVDPIYMLMLMKILGPEYVVWDKAAQIKFLKPGRETLHAEFELTEQELAAIKELVQENGKTERIYTVELRTKDGKVCAKIEKLLYIASKDYYEKRKADGQRERSSHS